MSSTHDLQALMGTIVAAFKGGKDVPKEQENSMLMGKAMQVLSLNWAPFDEIQGTLRAFAESEVAALDGDKAKYSAEMAEKAHKALGENAAINTQLAAFCKEDADPLGLTLTVLKKHLPLVVDVILAVTPEGVKFSDVLKAATQEMVGEWLEGLQGSMTDGAAGLQGFMQKMSMVGGMQVAQDYPQHAQAAMFGFPMLLNMLSQMHGLYRTANNIS